MLTKQEVERTRSLVVRELDDYGDIAGLRKLSDQAISAIDLAAENARLKAKLDAVKAECEESRQSGRRLSALQMLDILDKERD